MVKNNFDVIVIGAGAAGLAAARRLTEAGRRVSFAFPELQLRVCAWHPSKLLTVGGRCESEFDTRLDYSAGLQPARWASIFKAHPCEAPS
jgi:glycine/D-amino acid oxidase-like deaminating enzyme